MRNSNFVAKLRTIVLVVILVGSCLAAIAQSASAQASVPPAPVPPQITTAKTVFVANGGADSNMSNLWKDLGGRDIAYNQFYAGMKTWGRYQLVPSPEQADLVLEIRFRYALGPSMELQLTIMDAKTHFTLWRVAEYVQNAARQATLRKNFATTIAALVNDMKSLTPPPATN
jgi:hypothetical protein